MQHQLFVVLVNGPHDLLICINLNSYDVILLSHLAKLTQLRYLLFYCIEGGANYNVPPLNERCATVHVPSGPSSLAEINLMGAIGVCNAFQAPPSESNSTIIIGIIQMN